MKRAHRAREQRLYVCILASKNGGGRFRTTVLADNTDAAREKAERIARGMVGGVAVEFVYPVSDRPKARGTRRVIKRGVDLAC